MTVTTVFTHTAVTIVQLAGTMHHSQLMTHMRTTMSNWKLLIEYGPVAADCHIMVVSATSVDDAMQKAVQWAQDNFKYYPMITIDELPEDDETPMDDDFTSEIEWTLEEEEEFLTIVENLEKKEKE